MPTNATPGDKSVELTIRELSAEADLVAAYPLVRVLRPRLVDAAMFVDHVRRQTAEGYALAVGYDAGGRPVVAAGYRLSCTLARGPHLFVDDLVTDPADQGRGYASAMIDWLRAKAVEAGAEKVYLDSRDTAVGFYERYGFTFLTSKPCWVEAAGGNS